MDLYLFHHFRSLQANRAVAEGHLHLLQQLAEYTNNESLFIACQNGHVEIIEFLLTQTCPHIDIEATDAIQDRTVLGWSCHYGHFEMVQLLLQNYKCNMKHKDNTGSTALHLACTGGYLDIVRLLVQHSIEIEMP